jgi:hypothetical protein
MVSLDAQVKDRFLEFGVAPALSNAIFTSAKAPTGYYKDNEAYSDSMGKGRGWTTPINFFIRYTMERNNRSRWGIGLEYQQYGFKRTVTNPKLGYFKHEDLGVVNGLVEASAEFIYTTRIRNIEIPLFYESQIGMASRAGNAQYFVIGIAPAFSWDRKIQLFTKGFEDDGEDKKLVKNYRTNAPLVNGILFAGYKWVMDIEQPVKVIIEPQVRIPLLPSSGDENYIYSQFNLNIGIIFGGQPRNK